mmetsp:Transcript_51834/g.130176  ORF Transcript_51834/g.130176 Transcript_51834/m.130176 type:complete len:324 (-) Transcript_51834:444-1415(-)
MACSTDRHTWEDIFIVQMCIVSINVIGGCGALHPSSLRAVEKAVVCIRFHKDKESTRLKATYSTFTANTPTAAHSTGTGNLLKKPHTTGTRQALPNVRSNTPPTQTQHTHSLEAALPPTLVPLQPQCRDIRQLIMQQRNIILIDIQGCGQDIIGKAKKGLCDGVHSAVITVERADELGWFACGVELPVDEGVGEEGAVALLDVIRDDAAAVLLRKANNQPSFGDVKHFCCSGVQVGRVDGTGGDVRDGLAEPVTTECRPLYGRGSSDAATLPVGQYLSLIEIEGEVAVTKLLAERATRQRDVLPLRPLGYDTLQASSDEAAPH